MIYSTPAVRVSATDAADDVRASASLICSPRVRSQLAGCQSRIGAPRGMKKWDGMGAQYHRHGIESPKAKRR